MKALLGPLTPLALLVVLGHSAVAESLPKYRPCLLGNHPRSLVNLIDAQALMKRGQGNGLVMFEAGIAVDGRCYDSRTYRESPSSDALRQEVLGRLDQAQFEPAVYNHSHVAAYIQGTVNFFIRNGKPHVRVFLNQEDADLQSGRDFVAPQFAFVPGNTQFKGIYYPRGTPGLKGVAAVKVDVDADGYVKGTSVVYEHPPGIGFGANTAGPLRDARFIPGFRNGKPVPCRFIWTRVFTGPGLQMKTG